MLPTQGFLADLLRQGERLGLRHVVGPAEVADVSGVAILPIGELAAASAGQLVIISGTGSPAAYQVDIAIRRAISAGCAALVFVGEFPLAATSRSLAVRGGLPILMSTATPSELAVFTDRALRGGAEEAIARAEQAIVRARDCAIEVPARPARAVLDEASAALGVPLRLVEDTTVAWHEPDAVCIGEVAVGRLVAERGDPSVAIALPTLAAVLSRSMQHEMHTRFGPVRSRADLVVELVLAESSRVESLGAEAARAGLPVALSHTVAWVSPTHRNLTDRRLPATALSAIELYGLQLVDQRDEVWHVAMIHDNLLMAASEEAGAADHQRRVREVMEAVRGHARSRFGDEWAFTVGMGTPRQGVLGFRQSAAEARIATEAAIAAGRIGGIEVTDVTGLRRVLLDFYASTLSRSLLDDILAPLDRTGGDRAAMAIETLLAYLRNRNSLTRAAAELNLHPNAVNYRVRRAEQILGLDLSDPDVRFAVELACRVRLITS
ncbi:CdaR family transcriptional regulator [Amycolatopsis sp. GM8]|uniref:PucR family transcriptional regulator n=1 Tax=Amycolatopsis sp. GM8 TaxID=2896530 RepID=UPI001F18AABA|nr:helix-turn-helix domain-containing protein [Amycolatopsis sp. GM8]